MTKILCIEAPPRKLRSHSIQVAERFLTQLSTVEPDLEIDTLDLWAEELPCFDGAHC